MKKSEFFISTNSSRVFTFFLFCLFCAGQLSAATWYVKPGGSDTNAGNSWTSAYQTLTKALQSAASGDQIWVATGTYKPTTGTDRTISFNMKNGVAILGGFPATGNPVLADRDWETHVTILSGDIGTAGDNSDNSYYVVYSASLNNTAILDGFVVTAGNANGPQPYDYGGGLKNASSSPTIQYCSFYGNSAVSGGGVSNFINSSAIFNHCNFSNNSATSGGAMYNYISAPTVKNCSFSGNSAAASGGAAFNHTNAAPKFINCIFYSNTASSGGSAVSTTFSSVTLTNCSFSGNSGGSAAISNFISTATIMNCNIWGNSSSIIDLDATTTVSYSNVQGGYTGTGNSNVNPLFVNAPGDLRLQACSPVINKGSDAAVPAGITTDFDDNNRFFGTVDMGAYEYQGNPPGLAAICKNITIALNATGNVSIPASAVDNGSTGCNLSMYLSKTNFNCSNVGANNLLFVVSDNNFQSASCAVTVTVQNNTIPTALCKNATVQLDATGNVTVPASAVDNGSTAACGIAALTLSKSNFNCSNVGNSPVSLEVQGNNGNKAYCSTTITVQDNVAPTAVCKNTTVQLDATGNASLAASAINNGSADACGIATLALSKTAFNCTNVGTNTVTLTVTDNNGKTATCSATVTVQDITLPTAACKNATVQLDATGNATLAVPAVNNGSADGCSVSTLTLSKTNFNCSNVGANTVTLTVTDGSNNTSTCSATVTVQDITLPTAACKNATVQLDATGNATLAVPAVNNGSADGCSVSTLTLSKTNFNCSNVGANTVTLTVTDGSNNTSTCSATVTVQDNTLPTAVCKNATVQLDATGNVTVPASAVNNGSTDACGIAALTLSKTNFNCSNVGSLLVSLEVRDNNGNKAYCSATLTVQDNIAPTAVCKNATVQLDASGNATLTTAAINNGSTDVCGIASLSLSKTAFDCSNIGANTVTLTATDNNGKTATCSTTVTVQDNVAPTAVCQNATVQLDAAGNATLAVAAVNNGSTDACGIASLSLSKTAFDCSNTGANTVTLTATDNNGKTATCSATVTVQDNVAPTAVCQNATLQLDASGNATLAVAAVNNGSTDACGIASLSLSKTAFDCSNTGANTVTLTATDNNGKTATCSATVTVQDNVAPTAVCQNATVQLDASGNATLTTAAINNGSTDACGIASLSLSKTAFDCSNIGANTVTLTATDNNGKTATCSATVTVQDNVAPTAVCQNATVQLDASGNATLAVAAVNNGSADACGIASLSLSKTAFDCSNTGANTVTLTATDNNGKTATCSATVTVQDNVAPTAVCQNATLQLDASGNATLAVAVVNNGSADACGIASLSLSKTAFDCSNTGANTVTLTATDNNGKTATCSATVTVQDNVAPTAVCQNATVQLDASGNATLTTAAINNGSTDACGIASLSLSKTAFDCSNTGANTVTLTATDNNGKTATCSATVTVQDNVAPTAVCQNATVQLDASGNATLAVAVVNNGSADACGIASLSLSKTAFDCSNIGANAVILTATDNNGKTATCTSTVTVADNLAPTVTCPDDITLAADQSNPCSAFVADGSLDAVFDDNCTASLAYSLSGAMTGGGVSQVPATTFPSGVTTVTYLATDQSQHSAQCLFHVTVNTCGAGISGTIFWENDSASGVGNTTVTLSGDQSGSVITPANGMYALTITSGSNFTVTPTKNINKLNGLSIADAQAIQQHVTLQNPLPTPYKRIAADVNKSNSITTADASLVNQVLLGNPQANAIFNTSWRFVPAAYSFPNPNAPWGFPEKITLTNVTGMVGGQDFKGIKLGDVASIWANPANFGAPEASGLVLRVQDRVLEAGSEIVAEFRVDQLDDLNSFQFALHFDPEQLQLLEIEPLTGLPVSMENFGTYNVAEGEIRVVWSQATPVLLSEAAAVFRLRFKALESGAQLSEVLQLNDEALPGHVYNSAYMESGVHLKFSKSTGQSGVSETRLSMQSQPNPFVNRTTLSFVLPEDTNTELRVTDAAGRLLFSQQKHYAAGKHEVALLLGQASGMLVAELSTPFGVLRQSLVAVAK